MPPSLRCSRTEETAMAGAAVKLRRAPVGGGSIRDRLSALPDDLLLRVLSFLPAQQVVCTAVLSKRWKDLWRSVPGINLSVWDFRSNLEEEWAAVLGRMEDFVDNLLILHRSPCLDAFRLAVLLDGHDRCRRVDRWVRRAIQDNPVMLEISVGALSSRQLLLPYLSTSPCRRLRSLLLNGVSLDHSFAERLHSWWPDLTDLTLRHCRTEFGCINSDKLENLVVCHCTGQPVDVFFIRGPRLASLSVQLAVPFILDAGNSLVRASIYWKPEEFRPRSGAMLLDSLVNVTSFKWKGFQAMAVLDEVFDDILIFHNLRTLSLESYFISTTKSGICELKALGRFLHKSPNLEKLTLKNFKGIPAVELVDFPILVNLRTLCLHFCDLHDNFQILFHCLRISPNLEKLKIRHCNKQLSDDSMGGKGKAKSKVTYWNLARFRCRKLQYAEIIHYGEHAVVRELVSFLLDFVAPTITIKVTKPTNCLPA